MLSPWEPHTHTQTIDYTKKKMRREIKKFITQNKLNMRDSNIGNKDPKQLLDMWNTNSKMAGIRPFRSDLTLNLNGLNSLNKRQKLAKMNKKT